MHVSTKIFCGTLLNWGIKNSWVLQKIWLKRRLTSQDSHHITAEAELSEKYLGVWSYASATHHDYSPIAISLLPVLFNSIDIPKCHFLSKTLSCKPTEWADGLQTIGTFCLVYSMRNRQKPKAPDSRKRVKIATVRKKKKKKAMPNS